MGIEQIENHQNMRDIDFVLRAFRDGHLEILKGGKAERVRYVSCNRAEKWSDPEAKVRAAFFAELIYRYGYAPECIGIEITVPDRTPSDRADIVVFRDKRRTEPYAVIECKRDGISDVEFRQAVEQAFGNGQAHRFRANFVGVVAGQTRAFYDCSDMFGMLEREANIVADMPSRYGVTEEFKYYKDDYPKPDIRAVNREELIKTIRKCHQTLWGGGRYSPPMAFGEMTKLIFLKTRDEKTPRKRGAPYEFQIKTKETPARLAARIKELYAVEREQEPDVFSDDIKIEDSILRNVVLHLESVDLTATDLDTKGVAFEQFMDGFFKGDFGQYFTPRNIIAFAIGILDIQPNDSVIDPACGSGGFLLHALDHVRRRANEYFDEESKEHFQYWHSFAEKRLFGIEINEEIARVAKMNMIVHEDGHANIIGNDALEPLNQIARKNSAFAAVVGIDTETGQRDEGKGFSKVPTNPPFGAVIKADLHNYLSTYELSRYATEGAHSGAKSQSEPDSDDKPKRKTIRQRTSVRTEIIYCERVWQLLKPGGQAAIVVPDGLLSNSSLQGVRDWILDSFKVLAVVSLPQFAFAHFGAGVKSSVIFLEKRQPDQPASDDEPIFMAIANNIGYDASGRTTYEVQVVKEIPESCRIERQSCDLLEWDVTFDWIPGEGRKPGRWSERSRHVVSGSGLLGQYLMFRQNPEPFFV